MLKIKQLTYSLLFFATSVLGQQTEHYTQYQFNQFNFNPAVAGTKSCIDIRTGYRLQWVGIDRAPQTGFINAHGPLKFGKKRNLLGPKHGIGAMVNRDVFGPFSFLQAHASYALHLPINRDLRLSFGASIGVKQASFSANELTSEFVDPAITQSSQSFVIFPDARLGVWLADKRNYVGFSVYNLFANSL